ncbi:MAG: M42 family metallopeptidase [Ruminococcaceae bacterium]|nr:M42 family metallopeptidase [Oscillospiraceae bacterium]
MIYEKIEALCAPDGVVGRESNAAQAAAKLFSQICDSVRIDVMGNVIGFKKGLDTNKTIALEAHIDEIGLIIREIDEYGFLHFARLGGVDCANLLASEVIIHGETPVYGVVCCKPPHLLAPEDRSSAPVYKDMVIDIGYDAESAKKLVSIGDTATVISPLAHLCDTRIVARAIDDRAGVAVIEHALSLCGETPPCNVYLLATVREEVGGYGARTAAYSIPADEVICVDVSHAFSPGLKKDECGELGKGPMIGVAPILNKEMTRCLSDIAEKNEIPTQIEIMTDDTGTNSTDFARACFPCALISLPLRYMHTQQEVADLSDLENAAKLISLYIKEV